jgi:hypothetical protein
MAPDPSEGNPDLLTAEAVVLSHTTKIAQIYFLPGCLSQYAQHDGEHDEYDGWQYSGGAGGMNPAMMQQAMAQMGGM